MARNPAVWLTAKAKTGVTELPKNAAWVASKTLSPAASAVADGAASAKAEYALAALSRPFEPVPVAASVWLSFAPSSSRSLQFFAEANDGVEPLLDEEDELPPDDDDADDVSVPADVVELALFLLPQPATATARLITAIATNTRVMSLLSLFASGFG